MNFTCVNNASGVLEGFALIKTAESKTTAKGMPFLDMTIADASGEMNAKYWDYDPSLHGAFAPNDIVKLRGAVTVFNGTEQFRVERIRLATEKDSVRMEELVPCAPLPAGEMLAEIRATAEGFAREDLRRLVLALLEAHEAELLYWPAAYKLHHAVRGGLLHHTLSVLRLAKSVASLYEGVDADLLCAGAILHDIEKLSEFVVPSSGLASGYTVRGNLIGHLVSGAMLVEEKGRELGVAPELLLLLEHMLLSHHGVPEFGAAVRPLFLEAELLSQLDLLDARVNEMEAALKGIKPGEFSKGVWALDNRKMYQPRR
ncbi:MAG: HDIG domain-containing protein [Oscillospiraceae bacterium]|jgi:3'-5' exoribonuclease|nr:HDIG domain-containing protein [Oscillospiraceae bacterium]